MYELLLKLESAKILCKYKEVGGEHRWRNRL